MKKLLILLSALALTFSIATAEGKCSNGKGNADMNKSISGKCDNGKSTMKDSHKSTKKGSQSTKEVPKKGKCGQGKCG